MDEMYQCNRAYILLYLQKALTEVDDFRKGYGVYEAIRRMKKCETVLLTEDDKYFSEMKLVNGEYTETLIEDEDGLAK